jgi:hypothetical protein
MMCVAAAGCGKSTATVVGKVTYNGEVVPTGEIHFIGEEAPRSSAIGSDGTYEVRDCPYGAYRVKLAATKVKQPAAVVPPKNPDELPEGSHPPPPEIVSIIPRKYNDVATSGLAFTINKGRQTIDIELKD